MKKAVGYIRVSTTEQATEGVSLDAQHAAVTAYCTMRGFDLVAIVADEGVSAGKLLETRPGGAELLETIKGREIAHVVAYKLDRLFRDAADCLNTTRDWDKAGLALHLVDMGGQAVDTSTAMGRFFLTVIAGAAEMERNLISERTTAAAAHKRSIGERISGEAPFGYRFDDDNQVIPDEQEQEILNIIRQLRAAKLSFQKVANELAARGFTTRRGTKYSRQGVHAILKDKGTKYGKIAA